jgi:putative chitinase
MMSITKTDLLKFCPNGNEEWIETFARMAPALMKRYGVNTRLRWVHFAAQWGHETDGLTIRNMRENMNYRAERIVEVFGSGNSSAAVSRKEALSLQHNPEALAERVYGSGTKVGRSMGNVAPGDGAKFIGRGLLQNTGRETYAYLASELDADLLENPALLETPQVGIPAGFAEWAKLGCNEVADTDNIVAVTKRVNGGTNGLANRRIWLARAKAIWPDVKEQADDEARERANFEDLKAAGSRKAQVTDATEKAAAVTTATVVAAKVAEAVPASSIKTDIDVINQIVGAANGMAGFVKAHSIVALALGALTVFIACKLLKKWMLEDYRDGKYTPDVSAKAAKP